MSVGALKNAWAIDTTPEATYGTAQTTPDKRHPYRGNAPKIVTESVNDDDAIQGTYEHGIAEVVTKNTMAWSPEFDLRLDPLALYLKYVFGSLITSGAGPTYTHTINLNAGDAPSFTGYYQDNKSTVGKLYQYTGCKALKLTIKSSKGSKMTFSLDIAGNAPTEATAALPALSAATEALLAHALISTFTINAVDYKAMLEDFEITYEQELDQENGYAAGTVGLASLERTGFKVSGKATLYQEENQLAGVMSLAQARTLVPIVWAATVGATSVTANVYKAKLDAPEVQGGRGKQKVAVTFTGKYSIADTKAAQVVITNNTTSYI